MPTEQQRLVEAHRLAQAEIGTATIAQLLAAGALLDPTDMDGTTQRWLRVVIPIVSAQRTISARLAAVYLAAFRALNDVSGRATPVLAERVPLDSLIGSMLVTGPATVRAALRRGLTVDDAAERGRLGSARSGMRLALNGGRDTIVQSVEADSRALGWARATSGDPCAFCAMLASRGPVYRAETGAGFAAHDSCQCSVMPVYTADTDWPAGAHGYRQLWNAEAKNSDDPLNAFRRALASR